MLIPKVLYEMHWQDKSARQIHQLYTLQCTLAAYSTVQYERHKLVTARNFKDIYKGWRRNKEKGILSLTPCYIE